MARTYIYFHICCINNWESIVENILFQIHDSGLYNKITEIRCCVLGKREDLQNRIFDDEKINIIFFSEDISLYEFHTLNILLNDSKQEDFYVLYLHGKGVSRGNSINVTDWVNYMLYFNVYLHHIAIRNLKYNDCCGVNYQGNHYSGNFWWSKSNYIRNLGKLLSRKEENYTAPETWLTSYGLKKSQSLLTCKVVCLWKSGVDHYKNAYPEKNYVNCLKRYDSRIKRLSEHFNHIIINNYKCGFSSSNLLETQKVLNISKEDKIILFYRNIFLRTISTFINWCITDNRYETGNGWLLANIREHIGDSNYQDFIRLFSNDKILEAFTFYVEILEYIYKKNNHTLPQVSILVHYGIDKIDNFIELENNNTFYEITNIVFPYNKTNQSNAAIKNQLLEQINKNEKIIDKIRDIYKEDIEYFKRENIVIDKQVFTNPNN